MALSLTQICSAVRTELALAAGITYTQEPSTLTDGMQNMPMLQVYPQSGDQDAIAQRTERTTFGGGVRQTDIVIHVDLYAKQRMDIGEDMALLVPLIDVIIDQMETQRTRLFGLDSLKGYTWSFTRVSFAYGMPEISYIGARFVLTFRVF